MIRFLLKGLLRDRSRSTLPLIVVAIGALLTVLLFSLVKGSIGQMIGTTARLEAGHVKVTTKEWAKFAELLPNDLALGDAGNLVSSLASEHPDLTWVPRVRFAGMLDVPDENGETKAQGSVYGLGVGLRQAESPEVGILELADVLVEGRLPQEPNEALLARKLAASLELEVGDKATVISATMHGAMAAHTFTVSGLIEYGIAQLDRRLMVVDIDDARLALDMDDAASEIVGFMPDLEYDSGAASGASSTFNRAHKSEDSPLAPVMNTLSEHAQMGGTLALANRIGGILIGVFIFGMSIVLWNAGLMNGIRRYGELGVRLALGEKKGMLYGSMLVEAALIGVIGSVVGTALGIGVSLWFETHGLDISKQVENASLLMKGTIRTQVTPASYFIGFVPGVFASLLGTAFAGIGIYRRQTAELFKELSS